MIRISETALKRIFSYPRIPDIKDFPNDEESIHLSKLDKQIKEAHAPMSEWYLEKARILFCRTKDQAIPFLKKACKDNFTEAEARYLLAMNYQRIQNHSEAIKIYTEIINDYFKLNFKHGYDLPPHDQLRGKVLKSVLAQLSHRIQNTSEPSEAMVRRAQCIVERHDNSPRITITIWQTDEAMIKYYLKWLPLEPRLWYMLARTQKQLCEHNDAIYAASRAVAYCRTEPQKSLYRDVMEGMIKDKRLRMVNKSVKEWLDEGAQVKVWASTWDGVGSYNTQFIDIVDNEGSHWQAAFCEDDYSNSPEVDLCHSADFKEVIADEG